MAHRVFFSPSGINFCDEKDTRSIDWKWPIGGAAAKTTRCSELQLSPEVDREKFGDSFREILSTGSTSAGIDRPNTSRNIAPRVTLKN